VILGLRSSKHKVSAKNAEYFKPPVFSDVSLKDYQSIKGRACDICNNTLVKRNKTISIKTTDALFHKECGLWWFSRYKVCVILSLVLPEDKEANVTN